MSCRISFVRYGAAVDALRAVIRDLQGVDPLAAVTVVVSSRRLGNSLRHLLARGAIEGGGRGIANIRFLTLSDLADALGGDECRLDGRRRLTRSALGAAARVVLAGEPGVLAQVADQSSTETELVALYEELRHHGAVTTAALGRRPGFGPDLARLCDEMRSHLAKNWYDDVDLTEVAITALATAKTAGAIGEAVIVHLPEQVRPDECHLIAAVAQFCELVVHLGVVGDAVADTPSVRTADALHDAGLDAPSEPPPSSLRSTSDMTVPFVERVEAPDVEAEVRAALRIVVDHLSEGGAPTRVALLYPSASTYLTPLAVALDEARIAWNGPSPRRVIESAPARVLLGIAELAELGLARERLMAWINCAPIVDERGDRLPMGAFERVSRLAGITAGDAAVWHRHLAELIEDLERQRDRAGGLGPAPTDGGPARRIRASGTLAAAQALDEFVIDVSRSCGEAMAAATWTELEEWAREVLSRYLGWSDGEDSTPDGAGARLGEILSELGALDSIKPTASISEFARALKGALERAPAYEGRLSYGVAVRSLWGAVGLELDLAIVLGGVEGELPPRPRSSPLLTADERAALGLEAATSESANAAARHALLAVRDASARTVCSWRLRDSGDAKARVRSRFFGHDAVPLAPSPVKALVSVAGGELTALSETELVVATLRMRRRARRELGSFHLVRTDSGLEDAWSVQRSRLAHRFDRFDGRIGVSAGLETGRVLSPTTLENYACCPFRYFLSTELGVEVLDEPEKRMQIDRRERGSIVHQVLERFVADLMTADSDVARLDTTEHLARVAEGVFGHAQRLGRTGAPVLWARERRVLLELLEQERLADARRRALEQRRPVALEWSFGVGEDPPLEIPVRSGRVAFRGKVDRIDRRSDGAILIVDYKTGKSNSYDYGVDPVDGGRHLQLAMYALAARALIDDEAPVSASYRFLEEEGSELAISLDDALATRASEVVGVIADGVSAGLFPFNPGAPSWESFDNCKYCDFDSVCPRDRDDFWDEASKDPDLAPYAALVGGGDDE